jgi:hypothetical protein
MMMITDNFLYRSFPSVSVVVFLLAFSGLTVSCQRLTVQKSQNPLLADPAEPDKPAPSSTPNDPYAKITYYEKVAPLIMSQCTSCHQRGEGIAPFALETYEDVVKFNSSIRGSIKARRMPPPGVDNSGQCQTYSDVRWLSDDNIKMISDWIDNGMPKGDPSKAPPLPAGLPHLDKPDVVLTMSEAYTPNPAAGATDDYRCFVVDPKVSQQTYVTGYEVLPGDKRVVHHVILYKIASTQDQSTLEKKKSSDGFPGYECFGGPGGSGVPQPVALWAPGVGATEFSDGTGLVLEAGRKFVMQVHYNSTQGKFADKTSVALKFANSAIPAKFIMLSNFNLNLPANQQNIVASTNITRLNMSLINSVNQNKELSIYSVGPHMHTAGTQIRLDKISGSQSSCMMNVPLWDFNWQGGSSYTKPLTLGTNDSIKLTCTYDTTGRTQTTKFGEGTADEMCIVFLYATEK